MRWPVAIGAALLGLGLRFVVQFIKKRRGALYPASAKFSDLVILETIDGHRVVCGKVSAHSASGNEAGTQRFITNGAELTVLQEQANSERFNAAWLKICT